LCRALKLAEGQQGLASRPAGVCLPVIIKSHFSASCDMLSQHLPIILEKSSSAQATATLEKKCQLHPSTKHGRLMVPNHEQLSAIKF